MLIKKPKLKQNWEIHPEPISWAHHPGNHYPGPHWPNWAGGVNHDYLIYTIDPGQFQVGWDSIENLKIFFSARKEHLILAYKCKFRAWSSNLILMCQHLEVQCKANVLKNSEVELHWPLAQIRPSEGPRLSQQTRSFRKLRPEPQLQSYIQQGVYWMSAMMRALYMLVVQGTVVWVPAIMEFTTWQEHLTINRYTNDYKPTGWRKRVLGKRNAIEGSRKKGSGPGNASQRKRCLGRGPNTITGNLDWKLSRCWALG